MQLVCSTLNPIQGEPHALRTKCKTCFGCPRMVLCGPWKNLIFFRNWVWFGVTPPHSGPGGCRINLSKCTKNAAKRGNVTLTIAYHENEINLNESFKKMTFSQKTFLTLSMVTLANRGQKTASRAEPIFWGQTDLTQWGHISPISWGNSGYINPYAKYNKCWCWINSTA